jgi:hypothetical protein
MYYGRKKFYNIGPCSDGPEGLGRLGRAKGVLVPGLSEEEL